MPNGAKTDRFWAVLDLLGERWGAWTCVLAAPSRAGELKSGETRGLGKILAGKQEIAGKQAGRAIFEQILMDLGGGGVKIQKIGSKLAKNRLWWPKIVENGKKTTKKCKTRENGVKKVEERVRSGLWRE